LVLIQEPREIGEKDSTRSHPSFTFIRGADGVHAKCWIAVNRASRCQVTELRNLTTECTNHVQVVEVRMPAGEVVVIANLYDRHSGSERNRPAQRARWGEISTHRKVVIAGDMNAHSKMWNPRTTRPRNNGFWEQLIQDHDLVIWNSEEESRMGAGAEIHSIIDLTLSSPVVNLNWCIAHDQATSSDHEVLQWEILGEASWEDDVSTATTGWDVDGWDPRGKEEEEAKAAGEARARAQECYRRGVQDTPVLGDGSTVAEIDIAAAALRAAIVETLDQHARKKRWCSRSKRWWTPELRDVRKALGRARRKRRVAGMSRVQEARRSLRRAIRKAKKECWNRFLTEAEGKEVWTAAGYTQPRIDKEGQALVLEDGSVAEGHDDREQAVLVAHFPPAPPGTYEPVTVGGRAYKRVDAQLIGSLLGKASNTSAPGEDQISADIVKVFWSWDPQRFVQLVRACIRLGHHPKLWKTAKGVVIPKPRKPDYSKVGAYRVISLLDVVSKLVERTAAHLIEDHLEWKHGLHDGQFGCRKHRSCVDAVAVLMNRTQQAWSQKKVAGALFMDVKSAVNNVSKGILGRRMEALGIEADLIRWTSSFMSDRQVKLVLDGKTGEASPVDTGIP